MTGHAVCMPPGAVQGLTPVPSDGLETRQDARAWSSKQSSQAGFGSRNQHPAALGPECRSTLAPQSAWRGVLLQGGGAAAAGAEGGAGALQCLLLLQLLPTLQVMVACFASSCHIC